MGYSKLKRWHGAIMLFMILSLFISACVLPWNDYKILNSLIIGFSSGLIMVIVIALVGYSIYLITYDD
jgi:hypothetical protein